MRLGDILSKLAREEPLSGAEIETLRMLGNTLQNLIGLAGKVDPNTGHITELTAGNVEILRTGLYGGDRVVFIDQNGISVDVFEGTLPGTVGGSPGVPAGKYQYKFIDATNATTASLSAVKASNSSLTQTLLHARRTTGRDAELHLLSIGGLAASSDTATTTLGAYANSQDTPLLYNKAQLILVSNPGVSGATTAFLLAGTIDMGDATTGNRLRVTDGVVTLVGTAKRTLTLRPEINIDELKKQAVPDQVQIGAGVFFGYSMPVWNSDHEELYMRQSVPGRWDGASDIIVHLLVALSDAEDVGDYFKFQLSWNNVADDADVTPTTTHDVTAEQIVLTARSAQYNVYELTFTIDYDADGAGNEIQAHDLLAYRLRRVDATNPDVTNEIIVLDWHDHFTVDKMFMA